MIHLPALLRQPSAWMPIALSLVWLGFWAYFLLSFGTPPPSAPESDEGTAAHLFQLWLVAEVLMLGYFAFRWMPQAPKQALPILTLQVLLVLAVCFPIYYFQL